MKHTFSIKTSKGELVAIDVQRIKTNLICKEKLYKNNKFSLSPKFLSFSVQTQMLYVGNYAKFTINKAYVLI